MLLLSVCLDLFTCQALYVREYWQHFKNINQKLIYNWLGLSPNSFFALSLWEHIKDIKSGETYTLPDIPGH